MARTRGNNEDDFDERGLLKDGRSVRVSLMMRDSVADDGLTDMQRSIRDATAPLHVVDGFGNSGLALCRPGARYLTAGVDTTDHAVLAMRELERREAYADSVRDLQDAWKAGTGKDREVARIHNTGDTRLDAYLDYKFDVENAWAKGTGRR